MPGKRSRSMGRIWSSQRRSTTSSCVRTEYAPASGTAQVSSRAIRATEVSFRIEWCRLRQFENETRSSRVLPRKIRCGIGAAGNARIFPEIRPTLRLGADLQRTRHEPLVQFRDLLDIEQRIANMDTKLA